MLYLSLDEYDVKRAFEAYGRDYYSLEACRYFVEEAESLGHDIEFDVIGYCGDWTEYEPDELVKTHISYFEEDLRGDEDQEELIELILEYLDYQAYYVELSNGNYLVQAY